VRDKASAGLAAAEEAVRLTLKVPTGRGDGEAAPGGRAGPVSRSRPGGGRSGFTAPVPSRLSPPGARSAHRSRHPDV